MGDLSDRMRRLGAAVAEVSDRGADPGAVERARRGFVSGPPRAPARRTPWLAALAAACLVIAGIAWRLVAPAGPAPISFSVSGSAGRDGAAVPGVVGDWVAAGAEAPLRARFSDGSAMELTPGARMRVTRASPAGADVLIERGSLHAFVAHADAARAPRWSVRAGPFEVRVTGTTFDAAWDPTAETFELTLLEGHVVVTGPHIPPDRTVVAGERLVVSVRDGRMVLGTTPPSPAPSVTAGPPPAATQDPAPAEPGPTATASSTAAAAAPAETAQPWKRLAAKGKYRDAFAAAEAAGFGQEVERAPASDLMLIADAARFAGSPARAREALLAARRRFGVKGPSAFLLGKIAADQQGSPGDAVTWFETYLREEPGGPLAEQALGRILELTQRGSPVAAKRAAERYLARYPDGAYSSLARSLIAP